MLFPYLDMTAPKIIEEAPATVTDPKLFKEMEWHIVMCTCLAVILAVLVLGPLSAKR